MGHILPTKDYRHVFVCGFMFILVNRETPFTVRENAFWNHEIASVADLQWSSVIYICSCLVSFFLCFSKMQQWYQVKEYSEHT